MKKILSLFLLFPFALNAMDKNDNFNIQTTLTYTTLPTYSGTGRIRTLSKLFTLADLQNNTPPFVVQCEENPTYKTQELLQGCFADKITVQFIVFKHDNSQNATTPLSLPLQSKIECKYACGLKDAAGNDVLMKIVSGPSKQFTAHDSTALFE